MHQLGRILMIAPAPFEFDRGKSLRIQQSILHLTELGYDIDLVTYPSGRPVSNPGVTVERAPELFKQRDPSMPGLSTREVCSNISLIYQVRERITESAYDLIHAHDVDGVIIGKAAASLVRDDLPIIYDMHGTFEEIDQHYGVIGSDRLTQSIERFIYKISDHVIANWPHILDKIETSTPVSLIMDEPDCAVCEQIEQMQDEGQSRSRSGAEQEGSYILYTGNYASYQGIHLLLDAFREMEFAQPVRLVMTGEPPDEYRVDDPNVSYPGYVSKKRLAELLSDAGVLVSPRLTDGFPPMKILYYIRTDAPIVVTDRMCHRTVLDGVDGVIFAGETPSEFAEALRGALDREEVYDRQPIPSDVRMDYKRTYEQVIG